MSYGIGLIFWRLSPAYQLEIIHEYYKNGKIVCVISERHIFCIQHMIIGIEVPL